MTDRRSRRENAIAIDRWEDEGGASESSAKISATPRAMPNTAMSVHSRRPRLVVDGATRPRTSQWHPPIKVANQGLGPADTASTRYYLSTDQLHDSSDILLPGARKTLAIAPGGSSIGSRSVTVPLTTTLGTYYVLACADDLEKVNEATEINNCLASSATVVITP